MIIKRGKASAQNMVCMAARVAGGALPLTTTVHQSWTLIRWSRTDVSEPPVWIAPRPQLHTHLAARLEAEADPPSVKILDRTLMGGIEGAEGCVCQLSRDPDTLVGSNLAPIAG